MLFGIAYLCNIILFCCSDMGSINARYEYVTIISLVTHVSFEITY
jgi:hypothetical protein